MHSLILNHVHMWHGLVYALIFIGVFFEGDVVLFTAFYLVAAHQLKLSETILVAASGVIIGDFLWYMLGGSMSRFPRLEKAFLKVSAPLDPYIRKDPSFAMFVTKFTYGLYHPTLLRLRSHGMSAIQFLRTDIMVSAVWLIVIGNLGYWFARSVGAFRHYIKYSEIGLAIGLILIGIISKIISHYVRGNSGSDGKEKNSMA